MVAYGAEGLALRLRILRPGSPTSHFYRESVAAAGRHRGRRNRRKSKLVSIPIAPPMHLGRVKPYSGINVCFSETVCIKPLKDGGKNWNGGEACG